MSDARVIVSSLDQRQAVMLLAMALKSNGGAMGFPHSLFLSLPDEVEIYIERGMDGDVVLTLGEPTSKDVEAL